MICCRIQPTPSPSPRGQRLCRGPNRLAARAGQVQDASASVAPGPGESPQARDGEGTRRKEQD
eukprot:2153936-Pyramimonas_sp.AAC.1